MTNKKTTKRALFMSLMAMLLCFTMLLGTTYAWFTDSATSGSNVIKSGNLDIVVEYTLGDEDANGDLIWKELDGATDLFQKGLWEPGHTEVVALRIKNNGTLALKYAANMNIVNETVGKTKDGADIVLSDILTVSTLTIEAAGADPVLGWDIAAMTLEKAFQGENEIAWGEPVAFNAGSVLEADQSLYTEKTQYVLIKVDMAETVGNEANHDGTNIPSIEFGINVLATQFTYESDSFGSSYDANAKYPVIIDLKADESNQITIDEGVNTTLNLNGNAVNNSVINNGNLTISGGEIKVDAAGLENTGNATLDDVEMEAGSPTDYSNITKGANANTTYNNVDVDSAGGGIGAVDGATVEFNSGSVSVDSTSTSGRYLFYAEGEGTVITINGGEFSFSATKNQKRAYIYAGSGTTVYVTGGTFGKASTRSGYTAGILGDGKIIITGGTFGFDPTTWVADGYVATNNNGVWTVTAN